MIAGFAGTGVTLAPSCGDIVLEVQQLNWDKRPKSDIGMYIHFTYVN